MDSKSIKHIKPQGMRTSCQKPAPVGHPPVSCLKSAVLRGQQETSLPVCAEHHNHPSIHILDASSSRFPLCRAIRCGWRQIADCRKLPPGNPLIYDKVIQANETCNACYVPESSIRVMLLCVMHRSLINQRAL